MPAPYKDVLGSNHREAHDTVMRPRREAEVASLTVSSGFSCCRVFQSGQQAPCASHRRDTTSLPAPARGQTAIFRQPPLVFDPHSSVISCAASTTRRPAHHLYAHAQNNIADGAREGVVSSQRWSGCTRLGRVMNRIVL